MKEAFTAKDFGMTNEEFSKVTIGEYQELVQELIEKEENSPLAISDDEAVEKLQELQVARENSLASDAPILANQSTPDLAIIGDLHDIKDKNFEYKAHFKLVERDKRFIPSLSDLEVEEIEYGGDKYYCFDLTLHRQSIRASDRTTIGSKLGILADYIVKYSDKDDLELEPLSEDELYTIVKNLKRKLVNDMIECVAIYFDKPEELISGMSRTDLFVLCLQIAYNEPALFKEYENFFTYVDKEKKAN